MVKKKKIGISKKIEELDEDEEVALIRDVEEEDDDEIDNNALTKVKKPAATKARILATSSKDADEISVNVESKLKGKSERK